MYVIDRRAARTAARVLVVPAALAVLAATAPQAAAHTELDTSSPAANAALAGLPPRVTLTFSDPMTQKYAKVAVTAPDGTSAATGEPEVAGKTVTLGLKTDSPAGRYTVGYRVVSADGHPVSGSYTFTVRATDSPNAPATAQDGNSASPTSRTTDPDQAAASDSYRATGVVLAGAAALVATGAAVGAYLSRRRRTRHGD